MVVTEVWAWSEWRSRRVPHLVRSAQNKGHPVRRDRGSSNTAYRPAS